MVNLTVNLRSFVIKGNEHMTLLPELRKDNPHRLQDVTSVAISSAMDDS
jgi:hypothetical protein